MGRPRGEAGDPQEQEGGRGEEEGFGAEGRHGGDRGAAGSLKIRRWVWWGDGEEGFGGVSWRF